MSTPLGHVAAGIAIYFSCSRLRSPHTAWALPCFVLLAVLPDVDYLMIWFAGLRQQTRMTHSVLFCVLSGLAAYMLTRPLQRHTVTARPLGMAGFMLAPLSHLVLDFSVGTHTVPLFWPLPDAELISPLTLLPNVVHARSIANLALWRNAALELLVLVPVLLFLVARARAVPLPRIIGTGKFVLPLWCLALGCSLSLG
jgi:hypothetical protein